MIENNKFTVYITLFAIQMARYKNKYTTMEWINLSVHRLLQNGFYLGMKGKKKGLVFIW